MKKLHFKTLLLAFAIGTFALSSCSDEDEVIVNPITLGTEVTVNNTLQMAAAPSMGGTGGTELSIETIFGLPENALAATATVSVEPEFASYLMGLYTIDITENSIQFNLVAPANDPNYSSFFRTLEAGTYDRYYFNFNTAQNITGYTSSNNSVKLNVISATKIAIEIGEGFEFKPGSSFTITLKN